MCVYIIAQSQVRYDGLSLWEAYDNPDKPDSPDNPDSPDSPDSPSSSKRVQTKKIEMISGITNPGEVTPSDNPLITL